MTQSNGQHTPGPWFFGSYIAEDGAKLIASIGGAPQEKGEGRNAKPLHCDILTRRYFPPTTDEAFANAQLIAAAPELLAAIQLLVVAADVNDPNHESQTTNYCSVSAAIREARAAITKARGQS